MQPECLLGFEGKLCDLLVLTEFTTLTFCLKNFNNFALLCVYDFLKQVE